VSPTITDVVLEWGVSRRTVMNWLANGLPSRMVRGRRYMSEDEVRAWFGTVMAGNPRVRTRRRNRRVAETAHPCDKLTL
jgi:hypothetical protein